MHLSKSHANSMIALLTPQAENARDRAAHYRKNAETLRHEADERDRYAVEQEARAEAIEAALRACSEIA